LSRGRYGPLPYQATDVARHQPLVARARMEVARIGQDGPVIEHANRPWGTYTVLAEGKGFKVKTIEVRPAQRLSYQKHSRRSEHWFVVAGEGVVTLDGSNIDVRRGDAVDVACGIAHRIQNTGPAPLVFVEVQHGDYFGEDDIVRLDDDYGRLASE
jgi:mannose-6-phosphate isomerase